jgi:UDP-glucuronate decarboxylase
VEPHDSLADTTKARELLGWQPQTSFDDGLKQTIEWYQANADQYITK